MERLDPAVAYERQRDQELWQKGYDAGVLAATPQADRGDGPPECAICGDYTVGGVEVHESCLRDTAPSGLDVAETVAALRALSNDIDGGIDYEDPHIRLSHAVEAVRAIGPEPTLTDTTRAALAEVLAEYIDAYWPSPTNTVARVESIIERLAARLRESADQERTEG